MSEFIKILVRDAFKAFRNPMEAFLCFYPIIFLFEDQSFISSSATGFPKELFFVLSLHICFDVPRWQLVPSYLNVVILFKSLWIYFLLIFLTLLLCSSTPMKLPYLTKGNYDVGYREVVKESYSFSLFYPADKEGEFLQFRWPIGSFLSLFLLVPALTNPVSHRLVPTILACLSVYLRDMFVQSFPPLPSLAHHGLDTGKGYALFGKIPSLILSHLPTIRLGVSDEALPCVPDSNALKVVVFSHGLGGSRLISSSLVRELASHGYLVATIEHTDGTAACTHTLDNPEHTFYKFLTKEMIEDDTKSKEFRQDQISHRVGELEDLFQTISDLNEGTSEITTDFHNLLNLTDGIFLIGHSFGGATSAHILLECEHITSQLAGCILLDPWFNIS